MAFVFGNRQAFAHIQWILWCWQGCQKLFTGEEGDDAGAKCYASHNIHTYVSVIREESIEGIF